MKLTTSQSSNVVIKSQTPSDDFSFGISDLGMVFDILRNKLYSNPIGSICREVSCNARDANREVGKGNVPIEIHLPQFGDLFLKVKDSGPGISPQRLTEVVTQYAASTKRNTNELSGAFGLGFKTPFSYTDKFDIITFVDKIKYHYTAYLDETKIGKITLLHSWAVEEGNGTEIVVPVKDRDVNIFWDEVKNAVQWWDVRPITNVQLNYEESKPLFSTKYWKLNSNRFKNYYGFSIIVDGVRYPASFSDINPSSNLLLLEMKELCLFFPNGELSLSASRESIHWDDKTKQLVTHRVDLALEELRSIIREKVASAATYAEACSILNSMEDKFGHYSRWGFEIRWRGVIVTTRFRAANTKFNVYKRTTFSTTLKKDLKADRFILDDTTLICVNDVNLERLSMTRANDIFNYSENSWAKTLVMVPKGWWDSENIIPYQKHFNFIYLSSLMKPIQRSTKGGKVKKTPIVIYQYIRGNLTRVSTKDFETAQNKLLITYSRDFNKKVIVSDNKIKAVANIVLREQTHTIFAIDNDQFEKDPTYFAHITFQATPILDYVKTNIFDKISVEDVMKGSSISASNKYYREALLWEHYKHAKDPEILEYVTLANHAIKLHSLYSQYKCLIDVFAKENTFKENEKSDIDADVEAKWSKLNAKYPLFERLVLDYWASKKTEGIMDYLNALYASKYQT